MGGTWDLFRYPGIRSDSDMFTLGYAFKPWTDTKTLADGPAILDYIRETAEEYDVTQHIRYQQKVVAADWNSRSARWTVTVQSTDTGETHQIQCNFLYSCSGYYSYDNPYIPEFDGQGSFGGEVFHAQHWPEDLDYKGKRVVVIGSGATAVTLVPELARDTELTTMLQRSPSYVASVPGHDPVVLGMRKWLPVSWVYNIARWVRVVLQLSSPSIMRAGTRRRRANSCSSWCVTSWARTTMSTPTSPRITTCGTSDCAQYLMATCLTLSAKSARRW